MSSLTHSESKQQTFYESKLYMLSNFSAFSIVFGGRIWPTSEHAYQAQKFIYDGLHLCSSTLNSLQACRSAHEAKLFSRQHQVFVNPDWDNVKVAKMKEICRAKAKQHPYVRDTLLATGNDELIESSPTDAFWGWGPDKQGKNMLGKIWMELRDEFREKLV